MTKRKKNRSKSRNQIKKTKIKKKFKKKEKKALELIKKKLPNVFANEKILKMINQNYCNHDNKRRCGACQLYTN